MGHEILAEYISRSAAEYYLYFFGAWAAMIYCTKWTTRELIPWVMSKLK